MSTAIHYYCVAHQTWSTDRSPVTRYRDAWAFCVAGCGRGHDWREIEPVSYSSLLSFGPTFVDRNELIPA